MALRRDQIQALKDSLCLDNVDPATRSALNNLVDNLIPLFESAAIPELGALGGINSGAGINPGDEADMLGGTPPLGGGGKAPVDGLGGFEDPPPGDFIDDGGGGGGGQPQPESGPGCLEIFAAKTKTEIPASSDGSPGEGFVTQMDLAPRAQDDEDAENDDDLITAQDIFNCRQRCKEEIAEGLATSLTTEELTSLEWGEEVDLAKLAVLTDCYAKCNEDLSLQESGSPLTVYNISCEKIEKDKTVIVSYDNCLDVGYVLVEACGCD